MSSIPTRPSSGVVYEIDATLGRLLDGRRPSTPRFTPNSLDVEEYRVGGPALPLLPKPSKAPELDRIVEFNTKCLPLLNEILAQFSIAATVEGRSWSCELMKEGYYGTHFAFVETKWYDGCLSTWIPAADAMFLKLRELNCGWLKVLIADNRALHKSETGPILLCEHPTLIPEWIPLSKKIVKAMAPNQNFTALGIRTRQKVWDHGEDPKKVRVIVMIDYRSEETWAGAVERMEAVIKGNEVYRENGVEFEIGRTRFFW